MMIHFLYNQIGISSFISHRQSYLNHQVMEIAQKKMSCKIHGGHHHANFEHERTLFIHI